MSKDKKKGKKKHPVFTPLDIEWVGQGATVTCVVKGRGCDCRVEVVIGIVDTMDTDEKLHDLAIEGGKLVIKAMSEIFESHIDNPIILAISAMAWVKENSEPLTAGWVAALREANEAAKTTPATAPPQATSDPETAFMEFLKGTL